MTLMSPSTTISSVQTRIEERLMSQPVSCMCRARRNAPATLCDDATNVRERCLRSEAVWRDLASRQLRGNALLDSRDMLKAAALCA